MHCLAERCFDSLPVSALLFDSSRIGILGKLRVRILILVGINQIAIGVATLVRGCIDQFRLSTVGKLVHLLILSKKQVALLDLLQINAG